ncbi:MAG: alpha/beta hydrolase [Candidatus Aquilonibacter sp.]
MRYITALLAVILLAVSAPSDIVGTWEGTMDGPTGHIRRIMVITKHTGVYDVAIHSLDETDVPIVTKNVKVDGANVTMAFDMNTDPWLDYHRIYRATLGANGTTIDGIWSTTQGPPLKFTMNYHRVAHASWTVLEPKVAMVAVEPGVKVETLDWGGSGRPVLLLAGLGNTGHDFFKIVPALRAHYHVYSMTRRGFGNSSKPAPTVANYSTDRLGDDVLAVMNALAIEKPVLIGHSIGGEELSDIGTRYPQKVAGLIYLDAGYWYAFDAGVPQPNMSRPPGSPPIPPIGKAVLGGKRDFKGPIDVPILAIFANPHDDDCMAKTPAAKAAAKKNDARDTKQIDGFRRGLPHAKVIVIPCADHFVYESNTDAVLRDINAFMNALNN